MKEFLESSEGLVTFPPKAFLFKENEFSKDVYIIKRGRVRLQKRIGNKNVQIAMVESGGILGELSIIDNGVRSATAIAVEETEAVRITPARFKEGLKNVPDWFVSIARVLAQRIRITDNKIGLTGPVVNEANVTAILMYLLSGPEHQDGIETSEAERILTELLHISPADLESVFETLQKKKLITILQGSITTSSVPELEKNLERLRQTASASIII